MSALKEKPDLWRIVDIGLEHVFPTRTVAREGLSVPPNIKLVGQYIELVCFACALFTETSGASLLAFVYPWNFNWALNWNACRTQHHRILN